MQLISKLAAYALRQVIGGAADAVGVVAPRGVIGEAADGVTAFAAQHFIDHSQALPQGPAEPARTMADAPLLCIHSGGYNRSRNPAERDRVGRDWPPSVSLRLFQFAPIEPSLHLLPPG